MKKKKTENANKAMAKKINFWHILGIVGLSIAGLGLVGGAVAGIRQAVIHAEKNKVYSVSFDLTSGKAKGKRGDDAVGMVAGINGEKNDFDNAYPWKAIKEFKDENGDAMGRLPKFYEKIDYKVGVSLTYSVTSAPKKGYHVAPAFIDGDRELDYVDIATYETSIDKDGHLRSLPDVMPEVTGHTLDQYRELANVDGNQLFNWRQNQAIQSLFVVEFATLDSQSIMTGETQYDWYSHALTAEEIAAKKITTISLTDGDDYCFIDQDTSREKFAKANLKHVDINFSYEEDGENVNVQKTVSAKSVKFNDDGIATEITLDSSIDISKMAEEDEIGIAFGSFNYHKTGSTDKMKGSSRGASLKSLEVTGMRYRAWESWVGNTYTWCDGLATYQDDNGKYICVSMDSTKDNDRDSYKRFAVTRDSGDHKGTMNFDNGLFIFDFKMDSEVTYQYDYNNFYFSNGNYRIGWVGGCRDDSASAGAFFVNVAYDVSDADYSVRLSCIPQAR